MTSLTQQLSRPTAKCRNPIAMSHNRIGIPLTRGKVAIIDADDWHLVSGYKWHAKRGTADYQNYAQSRGILMHWLILPRKEGFMTDHMDGDGLNNTRANLRYATRAQNNQNRKTQRHQNKHSEYKGVRLSNYWVEGVGCRKKWRARIYINKKCIELGYHSTQEEAAKAYDMAAIRYHGEFATLNFPALHAAGINQGEGK